MQRFPAHQAYEIILLTILVTILLVAGIARRFFGVGRDRPSGGIAVFEPTAEQSHRLFAATFSFLFGQQIDPATYHE
jgi:hypothetical protein